MFQKKFPSTKLDQARYNFIFGGDNSTSFWRIW
jgi:hypothetical protein